jgi:hypothetical protein
MPLKAIDEILTVIDILAHGLIHGLSAFAIDDWIAD